MGCTAPREEGSQGLGGRGLRKGSCWAEGPLGPVIAPCCSSFCFFFRLLSRKLCKTSMGRPRSWWAPGAARSWGSCRRARTQLIACAGGEDNSQAALSPSYSLK